MTKDGVFHPYSKRITFLIEIVGFAVFQNDTYDLEWAKFGEIYHHYI